LEKILRILTPQLLHAMIAIAEFKRPQKLKIE